jgi:hypothetical protein
METTGSAGYYGTAHMASQETDPGTVLLTTQAALRASELDWPTAFENHALVTPSASLATSTTSASVMTPTTSASTPHQRSY